MQQNQLDGEDGREQDNPALSKVIERNIGTLIHFSTEAVCRLNLHGCIAESITSLPKDVLAEIHHLQQREYNTRYVL